MQTAWHQKVARALGAAGGDDRRLKLAEALIPHAAAHPRHHIRAQGHVALHRLAAQVEIAIAQARFLGVFLIAEHLKRQFGGSAEHFHVSNEHLDFAGRDLGIDQPRVARLHHTIDSNAIFAAQLFHLRKNRAIGVTDELRHAIVIAQVDKKNPAMIADTVHPSGKADIGTHVRFGQVCAGMAAICVHVGSPVPARGVDLGFGPIHLGGAAKSRAWGDAHRKTVYTKGNLRKNTRHTSRQTRGTREVGPVWYTVEMRRLGARTWGVTCGPRLWMGC